MIIIFSIAFIGYCFIGLSFAYWAERRFNIELLEFYIVMMWPLLALVILAYYIEKLVRMIADISSFWIRQMFKFVDRKSKIIFESIKTTFHLCIFLALVGIIWYYAFNSTVVATELVTPCCDTSKEIVVVETADEIVPVTIETPNIECFNNTLLNDAEFEAMIAACRDNNLSPAIILGLIEVESGFDRTAISSSGSGCYGYCQLNPRYFPADLNPCENIVTGVNYLSEQINRYDSLEAGLQAYHDGHDTGKRWYCDAVLKASENYRYVDD